jgi:hypothetical protein
MWFQETQGSRGAKQLWQQLGKLGTEPTLVTCDRDAVGRKAANCTTNCFIFAANSRFDYRGSNVPAPTRVAGDPRAQAGVRQTGR